MKCLKKMANQSITTLHTMWENNPIFENLESEVSE
jgi:hypothetical protein